MSCHTGKRKSGGKTNDGRKVRHARSAGESPSEDAICLAIMNILVVLAVQEARLKEDVEGKRDEIMEGEFKNTDRETLRKLGECP